MLITSVKRGGFGHFDNDLGTTEVLVWQTGKISKVQDFGCFFAFRIPDQYKRLLSRIERDKNG